MALAWRRPSDLLVGAGSGAGKRVGRPVVSQVCIGKFTGKGFRAPCVQVWRLLGCCSLHGWY